MTDQVTRISFAGQVGEKEKEEGEKEEVAAIEVDSTNLWLSSVHPVCLPASTDQVNILSSLQQTFL